MVEGDAAEGGVADGAWLLVDLLEHEVLVAGFFCLDGVPLDALDLEGEWVVVEVGEADAGGGEDGDFAVLEEVDVAGVMEDAGDVGGEEELALTEADDGRRAHAGGDEGVGGVGGEDADGEGAGESLDGAADGFIEGDGEGGGSVGGVGYDGLGFVGGDGAVRRVGLEGGGLYFILDEVGDDLGVGFGLELVALGDEGLLELEIVFDDAVVDDDEGAGAVAVGVGVLFRGAAVGGPAGVADAVGAVERRGLDGGFEVAELAGGAAEVEGVRVFGGAADGDAGGVVAAVFEAAETFNDDGDD